MWQTMLCFVFNLFLQSIQSDKSVPETNNGVSPVLAEILVRMQCDAIWHRLPALLAARTGKSLASPLRTG